ncbi:hypothetical protein [Halovivax limisalsi]|uniref:hypothetical protein n=1 Tax=Halovivax limisalsi TaxID=1453760 RepID=UPI001FFCBA6C|nr:hypothetical protein [Halovivax limisalsi]
MSINLHRVIEGADGTVASDGARIDADVAAAVEPGSSITVALEASGPNTRTRTISVELSRSEARLLGGRLLDSTE